jgi:AAA domain
MAQAKAFEGDVAGAEETLRRVLEANDVSEPEAAASSWHPVELAAELDRDAREDTPTLMQRTDGQGLFYVGYVNGLHGETECGKTWIVLHACAQEMFAGNHALFIDFEDVARTAVGRLRALGVPDEVIASRFLYVAPSEPLNGAGRAALERALALHPTMAVIDGVTDALHMHGLKTNAAEDIAEFYRLIARPIARAGAAVVTLDHVTKDREARGRFALGSEHKLAGIDGAAYGVDVVKPFARGRSGHLRMRVSKDRRGEIRPAEVAGSIADIEIVSDANTGEVGVFVRAPGAKDGPFRPTGLMERVSKLLESTDAVTTRVLRESVQGKNEFIDLAASVLVAEGFVERVPQGRSMTYRTVRPYREDDDPAASDA